MLKIFLAAALMVSVVGCTSKVDVGCVVQSGVDAILAPVIASKLQCTNQAAIVASLQAAGAKAGLCKSDAVKVSLPATVCTALGAALVQSLPSKVIPADWGCSAADATAQLTTLVTDACAKL